MSLFLTGGVVSHGRFVGGGRPRTGREPPPSTEIPPQVRKHSKLKHRTSTPTLRVSVLVVQSQVSVRGTVGMWTGTSVPQWTFPVRRFGWSGVPVPPFSAGPSGPRHGVTTFTWVVRRPVKCRYDTVYSTGDGTGSPYTGYRFDVDSGGSPLCRL